MKKHTVKTDAIGEKKRRIPTAVIVSAVVFCICLILFTPFRVSHYDDGGTTTYTALTYTVVKWKRDFPIRTPDGYIGNTYQNTCVYFFPDNFKSLDKLWEIRH